ncbi:hypothetical protein [Symbiobacterium thermophilum]|uniref:Uncharacterized protein n=1 Tax=Symbiobacterium thermophilum TaxID=2734 RepID=A0A953LJR6_SYMTR|nr:hypothetical protein [Symbiobacterium thermophilum]MBY6278481.1 hypothetical protein [Symbiobacterium thermophilum]
MTNNPALKLHIRVRNVALVKVLLFMLLILSRVLPERVTLRLGDSILRLLWCECRVGAGRWRRVKNALTMEMLLSGQEA